MSTVFYGFRVHQADWPAVHQVLRRHCQREYISMLKKDGTMVASGDDVTKFLDILKTSNLNLTKDAQLFPQGLSHYLVRVREQGYALQNFIWAQLNLPTEQRAEPFSRLESFDYDNRSDQPEEIDDVTYEERRIAVEALDELIQDRRYFLVPLLDDQDLWMLGVSQEERTRVQESA